MCTGLEVAALAGAAISAGSGVYAAKQRSDDREQEALYEQDAAKQHAENLVRARRKRVGEARAATAASGTQLDGFAEINTNDIERLGGYDESMTLLSGNRRARSLVSGNQSDEAAATFNGIGGVMQAGYQVGWRGKKGGN